MPAADIQMEKELEREKPARAALSLSVLIPAFNERDTIEQALARVRELGPEVEIVVVDDDPRVHQSLKAILFQYEVISFNDPEKALEVLLKPHEYKLVIVDVCMQGMTGIEVLEKIKKAKPQVAVMVITAHGNQDIVVEAMRSKADDYVEKPFDLPTLANTVQRNLAMLRTAAS